MSTEQRLAALETLLTRVQSRAKRPAPSPLVAAASARVAEPALAEPTLAEPPLASPAPAPLELDDAFQLESQPSFEDPPAAPSRSPLEPAQPPSLAGAAQPVAASVEPALASPVALQPVAEPALVVQPSAAAPDSAEFEEIEDLSDVEEIEEVEGGEFELDAPAPASHSSPVATSMEQALASVAAAPPFTPPPESGPEPAQPVRASHAGPTMEQLGATISLDEGPQRSFELDEPLAEPEPVASSRRELEADWVPTSASTAAPEPEHAELAPLVVARAPAAGAQVVEFSGAAPSPLGDSFVELLDASLSL